MNPAHVAHRSEATAERALDWDSPIGSPRTPPPAPAAATSMLEAALSMARDGLRVFPCGANKQPLCEHGFKDATTNEATIRAWWTRWPDAGIGLPTGKINNVVVLDVDQDEKKGIDGEAALQVVVDREGVTLPATRMVRTPRGGLHVYFKYPGQTVKNSTSKIGPGLDIRGDGG